LMNDRKELLGYLDQLLDTYCDGCFLFQHIKKEKGRNYAHSFCIKQCTVGQQLQKIGKDLIAQKK